METCRRCHSYATLSFARFDPHANFKDERNYPRLHEIYAWTETLIYLLVGLFALHAFLWFVRSLIDALRLGRPKRLSAEQAGVVAFAPIHRILYGVILLCFMALIFTGLPLKYSAQPWAKRLAVFVGGFDVDQRVASFLCDLDSRGGRRARRVGRQAGVAIAPAGDGLEAGDLRSRLAGADRPGRAGRPGDAALVYRPGTQAAFRALDLLGEVRLLGRLSGGAPDWRLGPAAVVPRRWPRASCRATF